MQSFLNRWFGGRAAPTGPLPIRDRGRPPSGNGASSLHLMWHMPAGNFAAVRATVEIAEPPQTSDLYFFALQATFQDAGVDRGGGHVGLQWNRRHPGSTAVNWGGYRSQQLGGSVLAGTESDLPSRPGDPNTRDYPWQPHRRYRLSIERGTGPGWWRGAVEDLTTGEVSVIRELDGGGSQLTAPLVWSEVFAPCDGPPVTVRWSDLQVADETRHWQIVTQVTANYQAWDAGGCTNTDNRTGDRAFEQITNTVRRNPNRTRLQLRDPR